MMPHTEYEDLWGEQSAPYSEGVVDAYVHRYATPNRLGHEPTDEDFARIHHGGPDGWNSPNTQYYWSQVSAAMTSGITGIFPHRHECHLLLCFLGSFMNFCTHLQYRREWILIDVTPPVVFASVAIETRMVTMNASVCRRKSTIEMNTSNDPVKVRQ